MSQTFNNGRITEYTFKRNNDQIIQNITQFTFKVDICNMLKGQLDDSSRSGLYKELEPVNPLETNETSLKIKFSDLSVCSVYGSSRIQANGRQVQNLSEITLTSAHIRNILKMCTQFTNEFVEYLIEVGQKISQNADVFKLFSKQAKFQFPLQVCLFHVYHELFNEREIPKDDQMVLSCLNLLSSSDCSAYVILLTIARCKMLFAATHDLNQDSLSEMDDLFLYEKLTGKFTCRTYLKVKIPIPVKSLGFNVPNLRQFVDDNKPEFLD